MTSMTTKSKRNDSCGLAEIEADHVEAYGRGYAVIAHADGTYTTYHARPGGYVREVTEREGVSGPQVCRGMSSWGDTLIWDAREPLEQLIARESGLRVQQ